MHVGLTRLAVHSPHFEQRPQASAILEYRFLESQTIHGATMTCLKTKKPNDKVDLVSRVLYLHDIIDIKRPT